MKNIPVIKPLVVVAYELMRWRLVCKHRTWWEDDVFYRRRISVCSRDFFNFESRYRMLRLFISADNQRYGL